jgi:tRNA pseudouridine55 synthase
MILRDLDAILLLDKPVGISSNTALQRAKRLFRAKKAGHTGSLDNLAEGLLPICFGEGTKLAGYLLESDKIYHTVAQLGITTTTGDAEGEILTKKPLPKLSIDHLKVILNSFIGKQSQIPPMFAALKHAGQPLYKLARKGITIEREARQIIIYNIQLIDFNHDLLSLSVSCSKGTYIRTLIEDIGAALGCGAYVQKLRRVSVGKWEQMVDFQTLENTENIEKFLLPLSHALPHLPQLYLSEENAQRLQQGKTVILEETFNNGLIKVFQNEAFLGLGEIENRVLKVKRLFCRLC